MNTEGEGRAGGREGPIPALVPGAGEGRTAVLGADTRAAAVALREEWRTAAVSVQPSSIPRTCCLGPLRVPPSFGGTGTRQVKGSPGFGEDCARSGLWQTLGCSPEAEGGYETYLVARALAWAFLARIKVPFVFRCGRD